MKGNIRKRGKDSYEIHIDVPRGPDGKRRQKTVTVRGKRKAEAELARLLHELDTGALSEPSQMTTGDYLKEWLAKYAEPNVAPTTYQRYEAIVRNHLIPALGSRKITQLRPLHIESAYADWRKGGRADKRKNGPKGLSPRTILQHHRVLRKALQQAVKWQILSRNPADAVESPKYDRVEMAVLAEPQIQTLLNAAAGTKFYLPVLLGVTTGMRRGEILALRWQDIDFGEGLAAVRRSLEQTQAGLRFKEPKAGAGRPVVLPTLTLEALSRQRDIWQQEEKALFGPEYEDNGLICAQPTGKPLAPNNFSRDFSDFIRKIKDVPRVRFHDLRHTHATILLGKGVHPKIVSERLGHSTISITMDVYSHVLPSMQEEAARKIDEVLRNVEPAQGGQIQPANKG